MDIEQIKGDGGSRAVGGPTLKELKEEVQALTALAATGTFYSESANLRFCVWDGQSDDGLKHVEKYVDGVEPFEGALDSRVRDVDLVINEEVKLLVTSALRARLTVLDPTGENAAGAAKMQAALQYYLKRKIGARWARELTRLANYMNADSPGVAFASVNWNREEAVGYQETTLEELRTMYVEQALAQAVELGGKFSSEDEVRAQIEALAGAFEEALADPAIGVDALAGVIGQMFEELRPARAKTMAKELLAQRRKGVENPVVDFPQTYVRKDEPEIRAMRLGEDVFLPSDVRDFEDAPYYFMVHNLTRSQTEIRAIREEWTEAFKQAIYAAEDGGLKGKFTFRRYKKDSNLGRMVTIDDEYAANRYQVITAVFQATNDDGVPGIYYLTFHPEVDAAAHEQRLVNYKHGKYPAVAFAREYLSNALLEGRGVADVWGAQQGQRKVLTDAAGNNALLCGVPPIISKGRKGLGRLWLKPFKEVSLRRDGDLKYMESPRYPAQTRDMLELLASDRDDYFGRLNEALPKERADLYQQYTVMMFMEGVRELLVQIMQLVQQFADDETLGRISGQDGQIIRSREEIMGQFDLELKYNPRWMDTEYLKNYGDIMINLVSALDRDKTINTTPIAQQIVYGLDPDLAPSVIRSVESAQADEVGDEQDLFARIAAGIEPAMDEDEHAKNYALRLQWLENQLQANPAWQAWPEINQEILKAHVANYQQMVVQGENAQVGRQGAREVLES